MLNHKYLTYINLFIIIISIIFVGVILNAEAFGIEATDALTTYESTIFNDNYVHNINIIIDDSDWEDLIENAAEKEYYAVDIEIDGETLKNVAFRTKGNSTLRDLVSSTSNRYSFKIEFDHYSDNLLYDGLDKLVLNNLYQDTTYMKDYISYQMMAQMDVPSPLTSYVSLNINGEIFGLYLAVEAIEDSFLERNFGNNTDSSLYKPEVEETLMQKKEGMGAQRPNMQTKIGETPQKMMNRENPPNMNQNGMNYDDAVALNYTNDDYESYENIFNSAITDITIMDKDELIDALRIISEKENLEDAIDLEEISNYFAVHNYLLNFDSYTGTMLHNYYLYEEDGILSMIPWDYNLSFGAFSQGENLTTTELVNYPIDSPTISSLDERPLMNAIISNESALESYHESLDTFISNNFNENQIISKIESTEIMIANYVKEDPTAFYSYEEFITATETLKDFMTLRAESIRNQLDGSIASTSETQLNNDTLIDASHLDISTLGNMKIK
ncbi:CotH kinase family protein [Clostridiaceae bacterium HSG29]|nr:CotH kinase family protein [Clostridiaceae bacterium HSG29]